MSRVTQGICAAVLILASPVIAHAQSSQAQSASGQSPSAQGPGTPANGNNPAASLPAESNPDDAPLAERLLVSPREPRCADDDVSAGGATVCGKKKDNSNDRLPIPGELNSATALSDGLPRAPDVMTNRITGPSIKFGCFLGGCPPGMLPDIDFRKIPAAPKGSDADRVGQGEIRAN